jgi:alkaline phosphatase D
MLKRRTFLALASSQVLATAASAQVPSVDTRVLTRIGVGSCANQERPQPFWNVIRAFQPDLFIFAGDNIYGDYLDGRPVDDVARIPESLTTAYAKAAAIPEFKAFRESVPHLAT